MKKYIFTLVLLFSVIMSACVKAPSIEQPEEISNESLAVFNNINSVETLQVPAKAGKITVVTFNGDIICLTKTPTSIPVPKTGAASKANDAIQISYVDDSNPEYVEALGENNQTMEIWQTLAFEDSVVGDYDYNDLVIHLCQQKTIDKKDIELFHIGIHPIAYGATKTFRLGCDIYYKGILVKENISVAENARNLFKENNGSIFPGTEMLNTFRQNFYTNFFTKVLTMDATGTNLSDIQIIWFIDVDANAEGKGGKRLYAVNNKYSFLDGNKRPYGIIITDNGKTSEDFDANPNKLDHCSSWFEYPKEIKNISDCYPTFNSWLNGTATLDLTAQNSELIFDITDKNKGHFVYQIENGNEKNLNSNKYDRIRDELTLNQ